MPNSSTLSQREAKAIGAYIRFLRKKKGLTQEQVSEGICSVTYLSKIETGKVVPNHEMVDHLYERLGVSTNSDLRLDFDYLRLTLYECKQAFDNVSYDKGEELYNELLKFKDYFQQDPEFFHQFQLLTFYERLINGKIPAAKEVYDELSHVVSHLSKELQLQFYHYAGIYYGIVQDYKKSMEMLLNAEQNMDYLQKKNPHLMLHLALTYSHLKNSVMAIHYATQALNIFDSELQYLKSIDCKMIVGISYTRSGNYQTAEKVFKNILKLADNLKFDITKALALHNLAYNYEHLKDMSNAKEAYYESLKYRDPDSPAISNTVLFLVEILISQKEFDEAQKVLDIIIGRSWISQKHDIDIKLASLKIAHRRTPENKDLELKYIDYLENTYIPFFEAAQEIDIIKKKYKELGEYYFNDRKYKTASILFSKALEL